VKIPEKLKYLSISSRISILLGIIIILTMGVFSTFALIKQENDSITSINNFTGQLSKTIEKILRLSMLKNRRDEISSAIKDIVGKEGITSVRILNHQGLIKFSSDKSEINTHIPQTDQLCISCHVKTNNKLSDSIRNFNRYRIERSSNSIFYSMPIYNAPSCYNESCHAMESGTFPVSKGKTNERTLSFHNPSQTILGFIEIVVSTKSISSNISKTREQLIIFTVIFALIASLLTYISIKYLIGKPVKNLVEGTMRVAQGDFKHEIPPGKAELKLLAESFNKMQKQLITTQSQLIESEKLASVGKLADEIANEINNPLTGIIVYSESLIEGEDTEGNKIKDYEVIRQEALKIRGSIKNILSLSRLEKPNFKKTDIGEVINKSVSMVEKLANFRNIQIITGLPKNLPNVSADPALLEQVFINLLLISAESLSNRGILNISAVHSEEKKEVEINFNDSGKGIPENILKEIFNPSPNAGLQNFEKTGISLTVCKDIIEMHGGRLIVDFKAGIGSTAIIKLPV